MRTIGFVAVLTASVALSACSTTGDLGRIRGDNTAETYAINESDLTAGTGLAVTLEERQMLARMRRFEALENNDDWVAHVMAAGRADSDPVMRESGYFEWLLATYAETPETIYSRIAEDARLDTMTLPATFEAICTVERIDSQRLYAADQVVGTTEETRLNLSARQIQNADKIRQFMDVIDFRYNSYSHALEQMLIHAPSERARDADARLSELAVLVNATRSGTYCGAAGTGLGNPTSRFVVKS